MSKKRYVEIRGSDGRLVAKVQALKMGRFFAVHKDKWAVRVFTVTHLATGLACGRFDTKAHAVKHLIGCERAAAKAVRIFSSSDPVVIRNAKRNPHVDRVRRLLRESLYVWGA